MSDPVDPKGPKKLRVVAGELAAGAAAAGDAGDGAPRDPAERQPGEIYPGCPVTALGVHGNRYYYLDMLRQLHEVDNHTKDRMRGLFGGRSDLLERAWPRWSKGSNDTPPKVIGWDQEKGAAAMMLACTDKGVWSPIERVRGLGAWSDDDGGVILHCGDEVIHGSETHKPGELGGHVYPGDTPAPRPGKGDSTAGSRLLEQLCTWNWERDELDAVLALGWIAGAMFGGALRWRPLIWVTGDRGTGKSSLMDLVEFTIGGRGAVLKSSDPTAAGIWQFLLHSTIPVILDEAEASVDNRRLLDVVKVGRQASSGGLILRGGADHKGHQFRARSCFAFSSIMTPPLQPQDLSRIALLKLRHLAKGATRLELSEKAWQDVGRAMRGAVLEQWARWPATFDIYRQALLDVGHDARSGDQYGTLLAMADMVLEERTPDAIRAADWARRLGAEFIRDQMDELADWQLCLNHLLGQHLDIYRSGERNTLGSWVLSAAGLREHPDPIKARDALPSYGILIEGRGERARMRIANRHPMLDQLFRETHWQGGVWSQAMARVPCAQRLPSTRFAGVVQRGWDVPLTSIPGLLGDEDLPAPPAQAPLTPASTLNPDDFA